MLILGLKRFITRQYKIVILFQLVPWTKIHMKVKSGSIKRRVFSDIWGHQLLLRCPYSAPEILYVPSHKQPILVHFTCHKILKCLSVTLVPFRNPIFSCQEEFLDFPYSTYHYPFSSSYFPVHCLYKTKLNQTDALLLNSPFISLLPLLWGSFYFFPLRHLPFPLQQLPFSCVFLSDHVTLVGPSFSIFSLLLENLCPSYDRSKKMYQSNQCKNNDNMKLINPYPVDEEMHPFMEIFSTGSRFMNWINKCYPLHRHIRPVLHSTAANH